MTSADPAAGALTPFKAVGPARHAQSLQARITAAILLTAITVLFVGCTLFMLEQRHTEQVADHRVSQSVADVLAADEAEPMAVGDYARVRRDLRAMSYLDRVGSIDVRGPPGRVARYRRNDAGALMNAKLFRAPLEWRGRTVGEGAVAIAPAADAATIGHYLAMGGALFFAATALALFLGRWLAARITTPVARLSQAMESVGSSGTFQVRVEPDAAAERGPRAPGFHAEVAPACQGRRAAAHLG